MQNNLTDVFINNIRTFNNISTLDSVYSLARNVLLDYFGVSIAGFHLLNEKESQILKSTSDCECHIIGTGDKSNMNIAALLNGISAHVIELDDGHRIGMLHLGAPVISALLAVYEKEKFSCHDFLKGIIIGYEVAIRLACCVQPDCKLKGYHATGTCGTVGAAMAIAAALHFDFEQMKSAFSAAITSAAGVLEMIEGDTEMKPYNAGRAAMDGLTAAYIGKATIQR